MKPSPQRVAVEKNARDGAAIQAPVRRTTPLLKDYKWRRDGRLVKTIVEKHKVSLQTPVVVSPPGADRYSRQVTLEDALRNTRDQESDLTTVPDDGDVGRAIHASTQEDGSKVHLRVNDGPFMNYLENHIYHSTIDLRASPWVQPHGAFTEVLRINEMRRKSDEPQLGADAIRDIVFCPVVRMAAGLLTNTRHLVLAIRTSSLVCMFLSLLASELR